MGGKSLRKCEVCGIRRVGRCSDIFLARFPLDPARCRLWVKLTGNEDLAYLPIQRLNENKFICGNHFPRNAFSIKGNRLKRNAIPSLNLNTPLADEILLSFPISILLEKTEKGGADVEEVAEIADVTSNADTSGPTISTDVTNNADIADGDINYGDTQEETDEQLFSWQRDSEINCDDFDINLDNEVATVQTSSVIHTENSNTIEESTLEETILQTEQSLNKDEENDLHEGYKCDMCNGPIYRFRYSCVECANYDLCAACEAQAAHPQHYLLRVPRPRPHGEIQLVMDTIRRFLTADLKSLRAEANFVNTLMDELKSEVFSDAGSDPVPDEPHYPDQWDDSDGEHEDCEMESNATHSPAKKDDQDIMWLDDDILEEHEIPPENSDVTEKIDNNDLNDRDTDSNAKLKTEYVHIQHMPEKRKNYDIYSLRSTSTSNKISKKMCIPCPKKVLIRNDVHLHQPERRIVKIHNPSLSNASEKEICIQVKRLSKEELISVQRIHDSKT